MQGHTGTTSSRQSSGGAALAVSPSRTAWRRPAVMFAIYLALSLLQSWRVVASIGTLIAGQAGDPGLTAMIMWWNATRVPFTTEWWNGLHYHPIEGVTAFTENLVGLMPLSAPVYWLTGNPIATQNIIFILSWALAGFTTCLLVRRLTGREDAAFLAGLAFAFSPYRATSIAHVQMLASFWMPLGLLGLHGFLEDRRLRWLWLLGAAWVLQSLSNGYFMIFGGVLLGCWMLWFCSTRDRWPTGVRVAAALAIATLPLVPVLNTYRAIHERFGLTRSLDEIKAFSATIESWFNVEWGLWLWGSLLERGNENLFPGMTVVALVAAGGVSLVRRSPPIPVERRRSHRYVIWPLALAAAAGAAATLVSLSVGRWGTTIAGIPIRMSNANRAVLVLLVSVGALAWLTPSLRDAIRRRSAAVFYAVMVAVIAILCFGPEVRGDGDPVLSTSPYAWLMWLPGFQNLRVPTRFWAFGTLCLAVAAALAFARLVPRQSPRAPVLTVLLSGALLLEGWVSSVPVGSPGELWPAVEPSGRSEPILELPLNDYYAIFRLTAHGRRTFNGVSGHNPPHYIALAHGLSRHDPAMLAALASLGPFDVVVNRDEDPTGSWMRYVTAFPGAVHVHDDGTRALFRIPQGPPEPELGAPIPIVAAQARRHDDEAHFVFDGRIETGWGDYPQVPGQWLQLDLGRVYEVAGLTHAIGEYLLDFPRRLAIDVSIDGVTWRRAWEGPAAAPTVLAYLRAPREGALRLPFEPQEARYIRLQQLEEDQSMWRVSEITVHAPMQ